ncbi:MAG: hypothetical protein KDH08_01215, partial [Anaerolineae bacterium]|nr:hypothetical protein [Anaerolineae bacterium]
GFSSSTIFQGGPGIDVPVDIPNIRRGWTRLASPDDAFDPPLGTAFYSHQLRDAKPQQRITDR